MNMNRKKIITRESNRIVYEPLSDVSELFFEQVYRQADRTLAKIIKDNTIDTDKRAEKNEKNEVKNKESLNVISFLAGRGRGKTSAMLSFLSHLNKLQDEKNWSEISDIEAKKFIVLPYIDAAMLAEAEYIIDVILAEMWDKFEEFTKSQYNLHDARFERLEREIKQQFINVRKAYLVLKEREEGKSISDEMDVPVPSALHELAVSVNLKQELQRLIDLYVEIFQYNTDKKDKEYYVVIAIDDVDMSGGKAHFILEQIRRFLCMQRVIVFITADIERLQTACEARYIQIYSDDLDRRKFINEYLEKVLPYNMRIYLPEIKERHDKIELVTPAKKELGLTSSDEKGMILEFMAKQGGIYFDIFRRKRHFLQNQSMRSMVNYFEQMIMMKDDCFTWLKADLRERIAERITVARQKKNMNDLFSIDYEDVNSYLISCMQNRNRSNTEKSLGQVLYVCRLFEDLDIRNIEFVNAIIMFYSLIIQQCDEEILQKVVGESLWGAQEYGLISSEGRTSAYCLSFDLKGRLVLTYNGIYENKILVEDVNSAINEIIETNLDNIILWLCSLLFVTPDMSDGTDFAADVFKSNKLNVEDMSIDGPTGQQAMDDKNEEDSEAKKDLIITLTPKFNARKNYLSNAFRTYQETRTCCYSLLYGALSALAEKLEASTDTQHHVSEKNFDFIGEKTDEILAVLYGREESTTVRDIEEKGNILKGVEILYSIGKLLPNMVENDVSVESDAYSTLVSSYTIIQNELERRDEYFRGLNIETKFRERFSRSLQAKVLLGTDILSKEMKEKFEVRLGDLLLEFRGAATRPVLQKGTAKNLTL